MDIEEFKRFVAANGVWFRGRLPESDATIAAFEEALGVRLSGSIRWLLTTHGYWHATGIPALDMARSDTLAARMAHDLAARYIVINNMEDGGLIILDTGEETAPGEHSLYWVGMEDLGHPVRMEGNTRYNTFGDYVADRLPETKDFIGESDAAYNPSDFRE